MPRVSRPALPASERKQGLCAVSLIGSAAASRICSRTLLVSEISLVEIRYCSALRLVAAPRCTQNMSSLNFGSWPGAFEDLAVDDVGRVALGVAMLGGLHVEHELRQRAVQARDAAAQEGEARPAEPRAGVEVQAQRRAQVDMVLGREVEARAACPSGAPRHWRSRRHPPARCRAAGWAGPSASPCSSAWMRSSRAAPSPSCVGERGHLGHQRGRCPGPWP